MIMRKLLLVAVMFATGASATVLDPPVPPKPEPVAVDVTVESETQAAATATATAASGATATGGTSGATSDNSLVQNYERAAPLAYAPPVYNTTSCKTGIGLGGSNVTGGVSLGVFWTDKDCDLERTAERFDASGHPDLAHAMRCKSRAVKRTIGEEACLASRRVVAIPAPPIDKPTVVIVQDADHTGLATKEQLKRAFEGAQGK